ncbi:MAG: hypothetical protein QNL88_15900 [Acidobacteriota bacterium]|nr:hypothetical protein [Acidobacteriota bacterium]
MVGRKILAAVIFMVSICLVAAAGEVTVPLELDAWRGWVLDEQEHLQCPFYVAGAFGSADRHPCAWPGLLAFTAREDGGRFSISWRAYAETWLPLPGGSDHWPLAVTVNRAASPVVSHNGVPAVLVGPGDNRVRGLLAWERRPEAIPVPAGIGRIQLTIDGQTVFPLQRSGTSLWLGRAATDSGEADTLAVEVRRRLTDGVPALLETRLRLDVSGQGREAVLGPVLPSGFVPVSIFSDVQALLDGDGNARLQLRPGQWQVVVTARAAGPLTQVELSALKSPWPEREIWSYQAVPRLRITGASGGVAVDPSQVDVPQEWNQLPAFSLGAGETLAIEERSRGMADDSNRLHLARQIWIDFDGEGMTARDQLSGRLVKSFRLDMAPPLVLSRAQADGQPLLVTSGSDADLTGVELRNPVVQLEATSRLEVRGGAIPVTGWSESFESVATTVHLPPGRELVAALGADSSPDAWIDRWSLLDVFLLMITTLLVNRLLGRRWAVAMAAFLALSYHESVGPLWLLLIVVGLSLIRQALPEGQLANIVRGGVFLAILIMAFVILPFVAEELRLALYPQLERHQVGEWSEYGGSNYGLTNPAAASAPLEQVMDEAQQGARKMGYLASSGSQMRNAQRLERYASSNVFQSGGGEPAWEWRRANLSWAGPVHPDQRVRLVITPVWLTRLLRILMVALLAAVVARILTTLRAEHDSREGNSAVALTVVLLTILGSVTANAQSTPDPTLLTQLGERLARAPDCGPQCGHLELAAVMATDRHLEVSLTVHAAAFVAVPIPSSAMAWNLTEIEVDGRPRGPALASGGRLWLALDRGVHRIRLAGPLAAVDSAEIAFPMSPARIVAGAEGWSVSGVREGNLVTDTLTLVRVRDSVGSQGSEVVAIKVPPFVRVERTLDLDLDWTVTTTVTRLAPTTGSLAVEVPLLAGESVLSPGFEASDGTVTAALPTGLAATSWQSRIEPQDRLEISAPDLEQRAEVWQVVVSHQWNAGFSGPPPTLSDDSDDFWVHEFHPLPSETLLITIGQPEPVAGVTLAIDEATLTTRTGRRSREHNLGLRFRSTRGGQHTIGLPTSAEVLEVNLDGASLNIRPDEGRLTVPIHPGEQSLSVRFRDQSAATWWQRSPAVDLGASASNLQVVVNLAAHRWVLMTGGPRVGPAVLYWGELAVMMLVALLLARLGRTRLKLRHWVLLGLGFSTFSWIALGIVVAWLFALDARQRLDRELPWWRFDFIQIALVGLTAVALVCLVVAIPFGLLGSPDMHVSGNGSSAYHLAWFDDLSDGPMPEVTTLSLPLWVYRVVMLVWALWLAAAVITWLRWGWECLTTGGGWLKPPPKMKKEEAPTASAST